MAKPSTSRRKGAASEKVKRATRKTAVLDNDPHTDPLLGDGNRIRRVRKHREKTGGKTFRERHNLKDEEWTVGKVSTAFTCELQEQFLAWVAEGRLLGDICHKLNITRQAAYQLKWRSPAFEAAWDEAKKVSTSVLEDEAFRRATKSSDTLLMFMLNARDPDTYKRYTKVILAPPNTQNPQAFDPSKLSREELVSLEQLMLKATGSAPSGGALIHQATDADAD